MAHGRNCDGVLSVTFWPRKVTAVIRYLHSGCIWTTFHFVRDCICFFLEIFVSRHTGPLNWVWIAVRIGIPHVHVSVLQPASKFCVPCAGCELESVRTQVQRPADRLCEVCISRWRGLWVSLFWDEICSNVMNYLQTFRGNLLRIMNLKNCLSV